MSTIPRQTAEETLMKEVLPDARTKRTTWAKTKNQKSKIPVSFLRALWDLFSRNIYLPA